MSKVGRTGKIFSNKKDSLSVSEKPSKEKAPDSGDSLQANHDRSKEVSKGRNQPKKRSESTKQIPVNDQHKKRQSDSSNNNVPSAKKSRKEQKDAIKMVKSRRPHYQLVQDALKIWGEFSSRSCSKERKITLITKLLDLVKGQISDIIFKGNFSRVVQSVIKEGNAEQKKTIFNELKDHIVELSKNNYSHFIVIRMIRRGTVEQREFIMKQFEGKVPIFMRQKDSSSVIQTLYQEINPKDRVALEEEFYGAEFATFKTDKKRNFAELLNEYPNKVHSILKSIEDNMMPIINKSDKTFLLNHSLLHTPLLNLVENCDFKTKYMMITLLKGYVTRFLNSRAGSRLAAHLIAYGSPKDRKFMIKSLKGQLTKIALEQYGYIFLIRIFNVVDDTNLVSKVCIEELKKDLLKLCMDKIGRFTILYLLNPESVPCNPKIFFQALVPEKNEDDELVSLNVEKLVPSSKKDPKIRQMELYNSIFPSVHQMILEHTFRLITSNYGKEIFIETNKVNTDSEFSEKLHQALLEIVGPQIEETDEEGVTKGLHSLGFLEETPLKVEDIMKHHLAHRVLRNMIETDAVFAKKLLEKICDLGLLVDYSKSAYSSWVIVSLLECPETKNTVVEKLKNEISREFNEEQGPLKATEIIIKLVFDTNYKRTEGAGECYSDKDEKESVDEESDINKEKCKDD